MMERAAVPPRTIKKVSDLFGAATFILDFFWGGIKSPKNTTLSSEFESSLQNVCSASRHSNFGPISKAAFFWILGEGHTAALRAGVTAWVLWRAPWVQWGGRVQQVGQFPHDRDGHAPLFSGAKSNFKETLVSSHRLAFRIRFADLWRKVWD